MSVIISKSPSGVVFAGNPVIVEAYSTTEVTGMAFLRIHIDVNVTAYRPSGGDVVRHFELSLPASPNETVTFDLSSCLAATIDAAMKVEHDSTATIKAGYQFSYYDSWMSADGEMQSGDTITKSGYLAIPGRQTRTQRMTNAEDTESVLGTFYLLTDKPVGEVVPLGGEMITPMVSSTAKTVSVKSGSVSFGTVSAGAYIPTWARTAVTGLSTGTQAFTFTGATAKTRRVFVIPAQPFQTHFIFVNHYGVLESIYCFGRRSAGTVNESEEQVRSYDHSFIPDTARVKRTLSTEESITLSTGPVSRAWARWFAEEFFTAERVWMTHPETGLTVPVTISADETTLYDEKEAGVMDLEFKVMS